MSSLIARGNRLYAKIKAADDTWQRSKTPFVVGQEQQAERWVREREREVADVRAGKLPPTALTAARYADTWIDNRRSLGLDWRKDRGILDHHILPSIGRALVTDVRTSDLIAMVTKIRTVPREGQSKPPSQRTVYNIYATTSALFRDARLEGIISQSPCILTSHQLGPKTDSDPEWRETAVFSRDETETIISTPAIPHDRRVAYALELLAGLRPGESAALRWRNYKAEKQPLGEITVARSHSTKRNETKGTKTEAVRYVPVHPALAAILKDWRDGWAAMMGREPQEDDLIVPMPPADARARTRRADSEPHRTYYYSGRRWRDDDLPALGWRHRRHYDMRATFITLVLDDGADEHIIETRVTHTKPGRGAFAGYNRGRQWAVTCAEVAKLQIRWRGPVVVQTAESPTVSTTSKLRRRVSKMRLSVRSDVQRQRNRDDGRAWSRRESSGASGLDQTWSNCDFGLAMLRAASAAA